ncbi:hypothetical protein IWX65_000507 [Arthrobacter sp. CAN_A214]|uniref:hypothetical protein n=1 Tax=Arthrobacter sp. CAN_A214 TaxID=2787720 RepID=UPI0018CA5C43
MASSDDLMPGGSEADRLEQLTPAMPDDSTAGPALSEGTGGSEADRLEQAAEAADDGEDGFPHGAADADDGDVQDMDDD